MSVKTVKATVNGQVYDLTFDEASGSYKATITAPSTSSYNNNDGHYYPVSLSATDDADNVTTINDTDSQFGDQLKLRVIEKVKPIITVTYPTASSTITNSTPTIEWTVTDEDSGIDPATISISVDGGAAITNGITKTEIAGGYSCSYAVSTALGDGAHSFKLDVADHDGNTATAVATSFTVDTTPPTLTITAPDDNFITNESTVTIAGSTNDETSTPVTLTVNGVEVTVEADGTFSYDYVLTEGENVITIIATDAAGKSSTVVRNVTLDTGAPVFTEVTITPNPVDAGQTYIISVKVID